MFEAVIWSLVLLAGITLMTISSEKAVEHSVFTASILGISPFMIGLVLVSLGTDLPEIVNSIISSSLGHADINAGDSIGSVLTQMTLALGLLTFFGRTFRVIRKEILIVGVCLILALIVDFSILEKGYISQIDALFLVGSWPIYMLITKTITSRSTLKDAIQTTRSMMHHITAATLGFIGVAVGAFAVIQSVITLSAVFNIPEYLISFFLVAIGTSLPELVVTIIAMHKKQYEIAIGDIIGASILDASLSIGIGPFFFPQAVSGGLAGATILYTLFASFAVVSLVAARERVDRKAGIIFIAIYLLSYILLII